MSSLVAVVDFLEPETIIEKGGLALLTLIVFAESGLLVGFFLPGDSLLFVAGFLASDAGDHRLPALFSRPDSRVFKQQHVHRARSFIERYGAKTIVLARFVPIVRTFAPIVAGVGEMDYRTFVKFNVLGGVLWGAGLTTLGYFLGEIEFVNDNIEFAIIVIAAISVAPVVMEVWRHRADGSSRER